MSIRKDSIDPRDEIHPADFEQKQTTHLRTVTPRAPLSEDTPREHVVMGKMSEDAGCGEDEIKNDDSSRTQPVSFDSETTRDADTVDEAADTEPTGILRGIKTLEEALRLEDFPMTKADIDYSFGDIEVEDGRGGYIPVRQLTERFRRNEFSSPEEVLKAITASRDAFNKSAA